MSTKVRRPVKQCRQCGHYLNGRTGSVCGRCFNLSLVPVECKFCKEITLVREQHKDNEDLCVCNKCDWEHRSELKCDKCGEIGKDALYTSHFKKTYNCKTCCNKSLRKCVECSTEFYGTPKTARRPICYECRLNNYIPRLCIKCNQPKYFHKLRKPESCVCGKCFMEQHKEF